MKTKLKIIALAVVLSLNTITPAVAEQWQPILPIEKGQIGGGIFENTISAGMSSLSTFSETEGAFWCKRYGESPCDKKTQPVFGNFSLPKCETETQFNCVEQISATTPTGEIITGEYLGRVSGEVIDATEANSSLIGATAGKWKLPGIIHQGGTDTYSLNVVLEFSIYSGNDIDYRAAKIYLNPYLEKSGSYSPVEFRNELFQGKNRNVQVGPSPECVWVESGVCGLAQDFADSAAYKVAFRITKEIGGWFSGRLTKPDIAVSRHTANSNQITITGEPVKIQRVASSVPYTQATEAMKKEFGSNYDPEGYGYRIITSSTESAFSAISAMREHLEDKSQATTTAWYLQTTAGKGNRCLSNTSRVNGIVTTNATAYQGSAPEFKRGFLNYRVAGMHYEPDGVTKSLGTYDLVMRSDVARCLYGLSKAPVSATLTITGEGDTNIATTVVGERNGWLKLAAYGFTFSEKTIKVKISKAKRTTITCVSMSDPKKTRKVTAIGPKCPTGFRKR